MFEFLSLNFAIAGGFLATVPFVLHLLRKTPAQTVPFTAVRFLRATLPRTTRRSSPEHWPLMLLRILAVVLLGMAFSRPFQFLAIDRQVSTPAGKRIAVLIDSSASMRRDGIRDQVLERFTSLAESLNPDDLLSVSTFSRSVSALITPEEWQQTAADGRPALLDRVSELWEPDWFPTETAAAMLSTAEQIAREKTSRSGTLERILVVITDFQNGSQLQQLQSAAWPENVRIELQVVGATPVGNAGISLFQTEKGVRVRLTSAGDSSLSKYRLQPFDASGLPLGDPLTVDVAPGQRRTITLPEYDDGSPVGIELLDDLHPFDNVIDLPTTEAPVRITGHLGSTDPNDSEQMRYYLQRVLDGDESLVTDLADLQTSDGTLVPPPKDARLIFVTAAASPEASDTLQAVLENGRSLFIALDSTTMAESLKSLLPAGCEVTEANVKDYAMFTSPDLNAPLLRPFADPRFSDFSSIRIWHHRRLTLPSEPPESLRILKRFDDGTPALVEYPGANGGRIWLSMTGWHPGDSQWALSSRFPPLLNRLLELAWPDERELRILEVGSILTPADLAADSDWVLTLPDQSTRSSQQAAADLQQSNGAPRVLLDQPGRWKLTINSPDGDRDVEFLVNVAAAESRTETLPAGQLQALGLSSDVAAIQDQNAVTEQDPEKLAQLNAEELESRQKIWRYFLLAALFCLVAEALLSRRIEQQQGQAEPAAQA